MENTQYDATFAHPEVYPRYICVVVQYVTKIKAENVLYAYTH